MGRIRHPFIVGIQARTGVWGCPKTSVVQKWVEAGTGLRTDPAGAQQVAPVTSAPAAAPPARGTVRAFLRLVMIEHSIFALPFAYTAALTAMWRQTRSVHWVQLLLITVAMVSARTVAMGANRILDRRHDALNPRTARRELVTGALSVRTATTGTLVALAVFLAASWALRPLCLLLAPIAVGLLVLYSYGKRFTDYPQVLLALAQFVAPVGAWIAVTGSASWASFWLGIAVGTWIGGFDLIYACQDVAVDRRTGTRPVPAHHGVRSALRASSATHVVTVAAYLLFGVTAGMGWLWFAGVVLTAAVLVYEHSIVGQHDLSRVNRAFFTANGAIGLGLFAFALADLIVHGLGS